MSFIARKIPLANVSNALLFKKKIRKNHVAQNDAMNKCHFELGITQNGIFANTVTSNETMEIIRRLIQTVFPNNATF